MDELFISYISATALLRSAAEADDLSREKIAFARIGGSVEMGRFVIYVEHVRHKFKKKVLQEQSRVSKQGVF
jgi:hypothetical protein